MVKTTWASLPTQRITAGLHKDCYGHIIQHIYFMMKKKGMKKGH